MTSQTKFSVIQTARITGKSASTIKRHIADGKLSVELNDKNQKVVDAAEIIRCYGENLNFDRADGKKNETQRSETKQEAVPAAIKELNDKLIEQYKAQIDTLKDALDKAQEGQNRVTLLLEKQTQDGPDLESTIEAMGKRIANQTNRQLDEMKRRHHAEMEKMRNAMRSQRKKSFWGELFK